MLVVDYRTGELIRSLVEIGPGDGCITAVVGLRFLPDGAHIIIADDERCRVSVFALTGEFITCIGVGVLDHPFDVDIASNGDIVVADAFNDRICVFARAGYALLRTFGSEGTGPAEFHRPATIAVQGNHLYVLDLDSIRVQVF